MSVTALIGAQWGDEGKGHIADKLAAESAIVARYNGGDNAGHSITIGNQVVRTHLIPAGAFHPEVYEHSRTRHGHQSQIPGA